MVMVGFIVHQKGIRSISDFSNYMQNMVLCIVVGNVCEMIINIIIYRSGRENCMRKPLKCLLQGVFIEN